MRARSKSVARIRANAGTHEAAAEAGAGAVAAAPLPQFAPHMDDHLEDTLRCKKYNLYAKCCGVR